jgi:hypothetical protein
MSHKRTEIRNALVALLTGTAPTYATDCDDRIYANRSVNLAQSKLPAIRIFDESESAVPLDQNGSRFIRTLNTRIEIIVQGTSGIDTDLDDIAKQVEDLISANRSISGHATAAIYTSTELQFDSSGQNPIGLAVLNYQIKYLS